MEPLESETQRVRMRYVALALNATHRSVAMTSALKLVPPLPVPTQTGQRPVCAAVIGSPPLEGLDSLARLLLSLADDRPATAHPPRRVLSAQQ